MDNTFIIFSLIIIMVTIGSLIGFYFYFNNKIITDVKKKTCLEDYFDKYIIPFV